ncbi:Uncharacterised protein [Campylobacter geochelonis]|uniref:Uncharacterized protein n=1 Tax=Campylobacter geochelonis TaxID=1780362 RepID=A0A128ECK4_9BACT|nr:Uncharacterised protein [Campylobacter geochelonis]
MYIITKNNQIYLEFQGKTKLIQKPLNLEATKKNLKQ